MSKQIWIAAGVALALGITGCLGEPSKPAPAKETRKEAPKPLETAPAMPASDKTTKAVTAAIDAWASAWEKKNVDAYLAAYSPNFKPEKGTRNKWEAQRRERLSGARKIKVTVGNPQVTVSGADRATAKFVQVYESDSYSDTGKKTLELENAGGKWLIVRERAD